MTSQLSEENLTNEICRATVISEQKNHLSSIPKQTIMVADFAKIKTPPLFAENGSSEPLKPVKCEDTYIFESTKESLETEVNDSLTGSEGNCVDLAPVPDSKQFLNYSNVEVKKELLTSRGVEIGAKIIKRNDCALEILCEESSSKEINQIIDLTIKTETTNDFHFNESLDSNICQPNTDKNKIPKLKISVDEDNNKLPISTMKLVRNPLAFLKNSLKIPGKENELIGSKNKEHYLNSAIKAEPILMEEDLENARLSKSSISTKYTNEGKFILNVEAVQSSINLNELIIKSESLYASESNLEIHKNNNLDNICSLSCNSLDVNVDIDFDDALSLQSIEDEKPNTTPERSKYFSIIEISSVENDKTPVRKPQLRRVINIPKKQKLYKNDIHRSYNFRQQRIVRNSNQKNRRKQNKRLKNHTSKRIHSKKYGEKDSAYTLGISKQTIKNLPKTGIKTRKKRNNKQIAITTFTSTKEDFPKPFKLKTETIHKEHNLAIELPKPIIFKNELNINVKNKKSYLKAQFQPYVRLKRLKSEELLVPLKSKHSKKAYKFKSSTNAVKNANYNEIVNRNRRNILIQKAFSLNPSIKLNRLSSDRDESYCNDQSSLYNRFATPYTMPADTSNESLAETDSKYFSPRELFQFYHSSTPDGSSMISGHIDSGVSTSTPTMFQQSSASSNTLLLEIAAQRAFINNHLMHFGYSPIQFDLYNNLHDLNIFLKYLLGNLNTN